MLANSQHVTQQLFKIKVTSEQHFIALYLFYRQIQHRPLSESDSPLCALYLHMETLFQWEAPRVQHLRLLITAVCRFAQKVPG